MPCWNSKEWVQSPHVGKEQSPRSAISKIGAGQGGGDAGQYLLHGVFCVKKILKDRSIFSYKDITFSESIYKNQLTEVDFEKKTC